MSAFQRAAVIQARVIGALMMRDLLTQTAGSRIPFVRVIIRPIFMVAMFYLLGRAASDFAPQGIPLLIFVITGYLTWIAFLRCFSGVSFRGLGGLLMFPHVTPLDLVIARMAVEFVIYTVAFVGLCGVGLLFEQAPPPADPLGVMLAFWSAIGLGTTMGLIASSIGRFTTLLNDLFMGIRLLGHALSGVFLLASDTPTPILNILRWNPLFHSVEWLRESWWAAYKSPIADPNYIASCIFFLLTIGLAFERASRRWQPE